MRLAGLPLAKKFRIYRIKQHAIPSKEEYAEAGLAAEIERLHGEQPSLKMELVKELPTFEVPQAVNRLLKEKSNTEERLP